MCGSSGRLVGVRLVNCASASREALTLAAHARVIPVLSHVGLFIAICMPIVASLGPYSLITEGLHRSAPVGPFEIQRWHLRRSAAG